MKTKSPTIRNIFIGLSGLTPQVIAETIYCLQVQKKIPLHAIHVITTAQGKAIIEGKGNLPPLQKEFKKMQKIYGITLPPFDPQEHVHIAREDYELLEDVRTNKENELFPDFILNFIRQYTEQTDTRLYCSLSGGRKTMSVAMAYALLLYGRREDGLYHVIASPEFEKTKKFFPEHKRDAPHLFLSEVPYVRLRAKLDTDPLFQKNHYMDMVYEAQNQIEALLKLPECRADLKKLTLTIGLHTIRLQPFHMALYLYLMKETKGIQGGKNIRSSKKKELFQLYEQISTASGNKSRVQKTLENDAPQAITKAVSTINAAIKKHLPAPLAHPYLILNEGFYGNAYYRIPLDRKLFKLIE